MDGWVDGCMMAGLMVVRRVDVWMISETGGWMDVGLMNEWMTHRRIGRWVDGWSIDGEVYAWINDAVMNSCSR